MKNILIYVEKAMITISVGLVIIKLSSYLNLYIPRVKFIDTFSMAVKGTQYFEF